MLRHTLSVENHQCKVFNVRWVFPGRDTKNKMGTTNEDIMKILLELNAKVDNDNKDMKEELLGLADKVDRVKLQVEKKDEQDEIRMKRMDLRMNKIETAMKTTVARNKDQTNYRKQLEKEQEMRVEKWKMSVGLLPLRKENEREISPEKEKKKQRKSD